MDKDEDSVISYDEFVTGLSPFQSDKEQWASLTSLFLQLFDENKIFKHFNN